MEAKRALQMVADQCSRQELSRFDVLSKLQRWELDGEEITAIMNFLEENRFVDDRRFARAYARDKFRFKRWGKAKIEQMLRRKHIPEELIREALADLPDTDYDATCRALLQQKSRGLNEPDPYKRKAKLIRFALSRGFDYETIRRALDGDE